jgi:signal transduction histidine kinase
MKLFRASRAAKSGACFLESRARERCKILVCLAVMLLSASGHANDTNSDFTSLTIAGLQRVVSERERVIQSFRIEGQVCAVIPEDRMIVVEDNSGAGLFKLPAIKNTVRVGERVEISGKNCLLVHDQYGIDVGAAPVVDNDGLHPSMLKSGSVFLREGFQPIQVAWFNGLAASGLSLEYAGPGLPRQKISGNALWRRTVETKDFQPGINFSAYNSEAGQYWYRLPDFERLAPVATGIATNFDLSYKVRSDETALLFDGYIKIPNAGTYTFYLESDDGSQLSVGEPSVSCTATAASEGAIPPVETFEQALAGKNARQWVEVEGKVAFACENQRSMEIELIENETKNQLPVTVVDGMDLFPTNLVHRLIRVRGICEFSDVMLDKKPLRVLVPSSKQVQVVSAAEGDVQNYSTNDLLVAVAQVRRLNPEQARIGIPVKVRGVVISTTVDSIFLQDYSGGIHVHCNQLDWVNKPYAGELWEIEGTAGLGTFVPIINATGAKYLRDAAMPEPARPTWNQLMNGNLDSEYVELRGVLTAVSSNQISLLTAEGSVQIEDNEINQQPLPVTPMFANGRALLGSLVRIRGCYLAKRDLQTRQVIGGELYLASAVMDVEEMGPLNPFSLPTTKIADLLWFDASASALHRTKVAGQILYAGSDEYFANDGRLGFRVRTQEATALQAGDIVEVVGFPKLGGPSPVLLDSQVRKIGHGALLMPAPIAGTNLLDYHYDSTRVQITARLVNKTVHKDELVLELEAAPCFFTARLKSNSDTWPILAIGSLLQVTGVSACMVENSSGANTRPFDLLVNRAADITVLQRPSWWTVGHSVAVAATLAGSLCVALIWITLLRRIIGKRTAQLQMEIETRQKAEQHRVMEQERIRIARDLHDELGAGLTEMGILGALAKNPAISPNEKEHYLNQLTESTRSLVTGLDEIVWAVNPRYDSVGSLITYYSLFAQRFLNLAGIACRLQIIEPFPELPLDSKLRHGIFLAFKEALNNVVRHSQANEVEIQMEVAENQLIISIRDNGRGIEPEALPGQDGLHGMSDRLQQINGECQVTSKPGKGTHVRFQIQLDQVYHD